MGSSPAAPSPPTPPTQVQTAQDFAASLPTYYNAQLQYNPLMAQQEVNLLNQYAPQIGQAELNAQNQMYPGQTDLTNTLTQQANEGIQSDVPDWMRQQYQSNMNAQLGSNVNSPIGADYVSRGLLQQQQDWKQYYQQMGMSISGKQPIYGAQSPNGVNYMSEASPQSALSYGAQNYGNYANAYSSMYNTNSQYQQGMLGAALGAAGGAATGFGAGGGFGGISKLF